MAQGIAKGPTVGLRRIVEVDEKELVFTRSMRRPISGVLYNAQKCRLVPDSPDAAGNQSYTCKIADVSETGFGVVCRSAEKSPELFPSGAQMTLEANDGKRLRVEVRWIRNGRLGLKRLRLNVAK